MKPSLERIFSLRLKEFLSVDTMNGQQLRPEEQTMSRLAVEISGGNMFLKKDVQKNSDKLVK